MATSAFLGALLLAAGCGWAAGLSLPAFLERCPAADPQKLNECAVRQANIVIPHIRKGIRNFGLASIDPLYIPSASVNLPGLKLNGTDIYFHRLPEATVTDVNFDLEGKHFSFVYVMPRLVVNLTYVLDGRILVLPLKGRGNASVVFDNLDCRYDGDIEFKKRDDGEEHMQLTLLGFNFNTTKARFHFSNLFNGDERLGRTTNAFLNENWREVYLELRGALGEIVGTIFTNMIQSMADRVPLKEILNFEAR